MDIPDAKTDLSDAPYPLFLSSAKVGFIFADTLISYNFVYVGIDGLDTYPVFEQIFLDPPLDILFALDQFASNPIDG